MQGRIQKFWKGGALKVGDHGWPTKNILGFRCSKEVKITLETISFWRNISISIFKFSPFLCTIEAYLWNLFNFPKFTNALMRKEKKRLYSSQWEKKNREKLYFVLKLIVLQNPLKRSLICCCFFFISHAHMQRNFCFLKSGWGKKHQKGKLGTTNS